MHGHVLWSYVDSQYIFRRRLMKFPIVVDEDVLDEVGGKLHVQQYLPAQDVGPSQGVIGPLVESVVGAGDIPLFMKWVSNWTRVVVHMLYVHKNSS